MTEHFLDSVNKSDAKTSWPTSIDDAIAIAKEIHDGLTLSQYNAYVYWWLVNSNDSTPTGLISTSDTPTYFGIGMKHFSYFFRPGYVRYDTTSLPQKGVHVSAFGTPPGATDNKAVVVLVNENAVVPSRTVPSKVRTKVRIRSYSGARHVRQGASSRGAPTDAVGGTWRRRGRLRRRARPT